MVNLMKNIKNPPDICIILPVTCTFNKIWSRPPRKTPRNTPIKEKEKEKEKRKGNYLTNTTSILLYVLFDVPSFDVWSFSMFSLSRFGPIRGSVFQHSVFRRSVPFDV